MKRHAVFLKSIKTQLPRRESERRNHPLSKHVDILTCIETRISMLSMTYSKYIELKLCCFIPGKVIDEVLRVLYVLEGTNKPLRTHEVLQELRDISSMAIEHFDEKISNALKRHLDLYVNKQNFQRKYLNFLLIEFLFYYQFAMQNHIAAHHPTLFYHQIYLHSFRAKKVLVLLQHIVLMLRKMHLLLLK